jgi:hypothetical protein
VESRRLTNFESRRRLPDFPVEVKPFLQMITLKSVVMDIVSQRGL